MLPVLFFVSFFQRDHSYLICIDLLLSYTIRQPKVFLLSCFALVFSILALMVFLWAEILGASYTAIALFWYYILEGGERESTVNPDTPIGTNNRRTKKT